MTTTMDTKDFVDQLVAEVVQPAADALMETRYFRDLRAGMLTIRRLQGYALQHTWFNRALLKSGAIRMIKASDNPRAFKDMVAGIVAEHDHPDLCQEFGINIGLTDRDFEEMAPVHEVLCHTSVIVASSLINTCPAAGRASGLTNETMVQRYSTELFNYLQEAPYNIPSRRSWSSSASTASWTWTTRRKQGRRSPGSSATTATSRWCATWRRRRCG